MGNHGHGLIWQYELMKRCSILLNLFKTVYMNCWNSILFSKSLCNSLVVQTFWVSPLALIFLIFPWDFKCSWRLIKLTQNEACNKNMLEWRMFLTSLTLPSTLHLWCAITPKIESDEQQSSWQWQEIIFHPIPSSVKGKTLTKTCWFYFQQ